MKTILKTNTLAKIAALIAGLGLVLAAFAPFLDTVHAATITPVAGETYYLSGGGVSSTATSITVTSLTYPATSTPIVTADLGTTAYATLEPGNTSRQEIISFTGVTQNGDGTATLTGVTRGLKPFYPYTADSTLRKQHSGGTILSLSNAPQLYNDIITYVNDAIFAGAADASTIVKGLAELATQAETALGTATGGSGPLVIPNSTATSTWNSGVSDNRVIVSDATGKIDEDWIPTTLANVHTWSAEQTFSATTTAQGYDVNQFTRNQLATTTTSSWTVPSFVDKIRVKVWGAGAAGSGTDDTDATPSANQNTMHGLAGTYCEAIVDVAPGNIFNITIGAGGVGASGYSSSGGAAGGSTTFIDNAGAGSFTLTAPAGQGGRSYGSACTTSGTKLVATTSVSMIGRGSMGGLMPLPNNSAAQAGSDGQAGQVLIEY